LKTTEEMVAIALEVMREERERDHFPIIEILLWAIGGAVFGIAMFVTP